MKIYVYSDYECIIIFTFITTPINEKKIYEKLNIE